MCDIQMIYAIAWDSLGQESYNILLHETRKDQLSAEDIACHKITDMMQSDVSGAQLSCSEFCACHASQCENQWTVRESSDEEDDGSSHSDSDSDID